MSAPHPCQLIHQKELSGVSAFDDMGAVGESVNKQVLDKDCRSGLLLSGGQFPAILKRV
jgi:hypothetical protein